VRNSILIILILLFAGSLSWCIYRDIRIEKEYTGDLRNRIAGARLQKDGRPPYFYKWNKEDGLRYYDPQNFDTLKVSNITATPFFHQLLYPLADLEQRTISKIWLAAEYLFLFIMAAIAFSLCRSTAQQAAVAIVTGIFLFTNAWTGHVAAGQLYITIPFFVMLFYYFLNHGKGIGFAVAAGTCAAFLLLIRPNTLVFLLPLSLLLPRYPLKYKLSFFIAVVMVFFFALNSHRKISYWNNYRQALSEQLKSHQHLNPALQVNTPDPVYRNWEGWDMNQVAKDAALFPYTYNMEHGNVFVLLNYSLHTRVPVWLLAAGSLLFMAGLFILFLKKNQPLSASPLHKIVILAFCMYMATDIFSPIHRFQYNASQWLFPLLLAASNYKPGNRWAWSLIVAGLILNSLNLPFMVMEQTLGEYILVAGFLILLLKHKPRSLA
jgi:hypothetical protein